MSGINQEAVESNAMLGPGTSFIQNPFEIHQLTLKVREALTLLRKQKQSGGDQTDASQTRYQPSGKQCLLQQNEDRDPRNPEQVHHADGEEKQHYCPAAAQTIETVAGPHDKCAADTFPPFSQEEAHR